MEKRERRERRIRDFGECLVFSEEKMGAFDRVLTLCARSGKAGLQPERGKDALRLPVFFCPNFALK